MKFETKVGKSIQQAFEEYHAANPLIYEKFKQLAISAIGSGKTKISFKLIMNVIRWEYFMSTIEPNEFSIDGVERFKINDVYGSRYARMFVEHFPEYQHHVNLRNLRS